MAYGEVDTEDSDSEIKFQQAFIISFVCMKNISWLGIPVSVNINFLRSYSPIQQHSTSAAGMTDTALIRQLGADFLA
jgi:hypothetical protein